MEDEIYLSDIFRVLWKSRYMIIGIFAIFVLVAGVVSFAVMSPSYRSSAIVALGNYGDPIYTSQDFATSIMLSDEYLLDIIEQLSFEVPPDDFRAFQDSIDVAPVEGSSNLLFISAEREDAQECVEIVETIVGLFVERCEDSYNKYVKLLYEDLASTQERLKVVETDSSQTREAVVELSNAPGNPMSENELRVSRTLDLLNSQESRRSSLLDHELALQKQLTLLRQLEVIQEAREPVAPIKSKRALLVGIAGILGLMVGVLAAFLWEGLRRAVE